MAAPFEPAFFEYDPPGVTDGHFRVETLYTGLSAGTELTFYKGTNPYLHAAFDAELGVFRTDRAGTGYPVRRLGYMEVGRVVESQCAAVSPGRWLRWPTGTRPGMWPTPRTSAL